jgi:peptide/nickel transport system permease protein
MLHEAHTYGAFTSGAWWTILPAGLGISMICLVFMDIGRKLEERADPRLAAETKRELLEEAERG